MSAVKLSLIICTRNRAAALPDCLAAVAASILRADVADKAEIIVVDNGSTDATAAVIGSWTEKAPARVCHVFEPRPGLSAARNAGIRSACGHLVAFTDDDCRVSLEYVSDLLRHDAADGDDLVMRSGSVVLGDPQDLPLTIKPVAQSFRWKVPMSLENEAQLLGGALIGCNVAMRRAVLERVGYFDEKLGAGTACHAAEDTDYFYRAYLTGIALEMVPDMLVAHFHGRRQISERHKLLRNYAIGNGALCFKYLFIYPRFARHLLWAAKSVVYEILDWPKDAKSWISFDRFRFMLKGAFLYGLLSIRDCTAARPVTRKRGDTRLRPRSYEDRSGLRRGPPQIMKPTILNGRRARIAPRPAGFLGV